MKKRFLIIIITIILFTVGFELYLRNYWGFCDTVLIQESNKYEYIPQANQNRFRFRKHVRYNEYSMRSDPLDSTDKLRILGFGDSVINGGVQTEQDSLATSIIEKKLIKDKGEGYRCCNISAGSWGPDNCFAYLQEKGDFNACLIFLVVSSHDAYDNMIFQKILDLNPSYPSQQYNSAIFEILDRYLIPRLLKKKKEEGDRIVKGNTFNTGFLSFYYYTEEKIPFFIYLHPNKREVKEGQYDEQGNEIIRFCELYHISLIKGIEYEAVSGFRDDIHLNEQGQRVLANTLLPEIEKLLSTNRK